MNLRSKITLVLITLSFQVHGKEIVLISHDGDLKRAEYIKEIIINERQIPSSFITIIQNNGTCRTKIKNIVHLCVRNKQMELAEINRKIVLGQLREFKNEKRI